MHNSEQPIGPGCGVTPTAGAFFWSLLLTQHGPRHVELVVK